MRQSQFPRCCGAAILSGFYDPWDDEAITDKLAGEVKDGVFEQDYSLLKTYADILQVRDYLKRKTYEAVGNYAILILTLNDDQDGSRIGEEVRRVGFKQVSEHENPNSGSDIHTYIYEVPN